MFGKAFVMKSVSMRTNNRRRSSLQDVVRRRQREEFTGRERQILTFCENLGRSLEDERRKFFFNISGQGGAGKTWLLRRFRHFTESNEGIVAWSDALEKDVPSAMGKIAEQMEQNGYNLQSFSERYRVYCQKRQELETDPEAPQGLSTLLGRTVAKTSLHLAKQAPIVGVALDFVDEDALTEQAGALANYIARKISNKDEIRLVTKPIEVLTPLFLKGISDIPEKYTIGIFFDTYENTSSYIDPWLRDVIEGCYGDVPANIVISIAGQHELDRNLWAQYEGLIVRFNLDPFTQEEAREYLSKKGITDEKVVSVILHLSGRLPLLVATLASEGPVDPLEVGDPSGTAVERFLKWVDDARKREIALEASILRRINRDTFAVLVGEKDVDAMFSWLSSMPFIEQRGDIWIYHDVVRPQMLRHKYRISPDTWVKLHKRLEEFYREQQQKLALPELRGNLDPNWQMCALEIVYHYMCQQPRDRQGFAVEEFISAYRFKMSFGRLMAETIRQVGEDCVIEETKQVGQCFIDGIVSIEQENHREIAGLFSYILSFQGLNDENHAFVLIERASAYRELNQYDKALNDINQAIYLQPNNHTHYLARSALNMHRNDLEKSIYDIDQSIKLNKNNNSLYIMRCTVNIIKGDYESALLDTDKFNSPENEVVYLLFRGSVLSYLERNKEALELYNRAIEITENDIDIDIDTLSGIRERKLKILLEIGSIDEVIDESNKILEIKPESFDIFVKRVDAYIDNNRFEDALIDLEKMIKLNSNLALTIAKKAEVYQWMGNYEEAILHYNQAIELDSERSKRFTVLRGLTFSYLGKYEEALRDYYLALDSDGNSFHILYNIAIVKARWRGIEDAKKEIEAARLSLLNAMESYSASAFYGLGGIEAMLGNVEAALTYLQKSFNVDKSSVKWVKHDIAWLDIRMNPQFISLIT